MSKKIILLLTLLFLGLSNYRAQTWDWMKALNYNNSVFSKVQLSKSVQGNFLINCTSVSTSSYNSTLIFCSPTGDTLWKRQYPGLRIEEAIMDQSNQIYFSGSFADTIFIDETRIVSNGARDAIVGKLDENGGYINHISYGSASPESAYSLALYNNDLFVAGTFANSFTLEESTFNASGNFKTYVIKLDTSLHLLKTFQTDSSAINSVGIKLKIDETGSVYVMGNGEGFIRFATSTIYLSEGGEYITKFSSDLEVRWAKTIILHFMHGSYIKNILFDSHQNFIIAQRTGGGGGASHHVKVQKFDSLGYSVSSIMTPINDDGFIAIDPSDNLWIVGRDYPWAGESKFTICKISPSNESDTLFYDNLILHSLNGFESDSEGGFYISGANHAGSYLGPFSCAEDGVGFIAHYTYGIFTNGPALADNESFNIYPNPSTGIFTIELNEQEPENISAICVYDVLGKCILTQPYNNESLQQIDLSGAGKGIYFVEVELIDGSTADRKKPNRKIVLN